MSSHKTHIYDVEDCDDYDYDDFCMTQIVKSKNDKNKNKKESKTTVYSNKHVRNYTKRFNK